MLLDEKGALDQDLDSLHSGHLLTMFRIRPLRGLAHIDVPILRRGIQKGPRELFHHFNSLLERTMFHKQLTAGCTLWVLDGKLVGMALVRAGANCKPIGIFSRLIRHEPSTHLRSEQSSPTAILHALPLPVLGSLSVGPTERLGHS